jgi:hypothetical protein
VPAAAKQPPDLPEHGFLSNGSYPSPNVAYQGVHSLIGYGAILTAQLKLPHWSYGFFAVLVFALLKEFLIDIFGKEHDSFLSSLQDFGFYMLGAAVGIVVVAAR